jgi:hypothetical protein
MYNTCRRPVLLTTRALAAVTSCTSKVAGRPPLGDAASPALIGHAWALKPAATPLCPTARCADAHVRHGPS